MSGDQSIDQKTKGRADFSSSRRTPENILAEGEQAGVILSSEAQQSYEGTRYNFDSNLMGDVQTPGELSKVFELVNIARNYAELDEHGEHIALLQQVADRTELATEEYVRWQRPYHVDAKAAPEKWISLQEHLEVNGYDMSQIFRDATTLTDDQSGEARKIVDDARNEEG